MARMMDGRTDEQMNVCVAKLLPTNVNSQQTHGVEDLYVCSIWTPRSKKEKKNTQQQ